MSMLPLLVAEHVTVDFGGNRALSDVGVTLQAGEITGLIGPNGAGKTTLFNVVTGMQAPTTGRVLLDGHDVSRLETHKRARLGIARTFQRLELFLDLSVRDNLRVAGEIRNRWNTFGGRSLRSEVAEETERVLDLVGLTRLADNDVSELPTGTARVVELARALMVRPRVLLLDEPASGQTDDETKAFESLLRRLVRDDGLTVLLIEHDMGLVMDVCDRIHVLDFGQIIAVGTPDEVRNDSRVIDAYLGTTAR
jgi:branched-chain amino acid transport system ATP-binding protein